MKQKVIFLVLILISVSLLSCSDGNVNSITIHNRASNDVTLSFKGTLTDVPAGGTATLTDILAGEYEYDTIFEIPGNATSSSSSESCAGTMILNAGTEILLVYTSTFDGSSYSLSASITSSDNLVEDGILPNPIGP